MNDEIKDKEAPAAPAGEVKKDPKPKKKPGKKEVNLGGRPSLWVNPEVLAQLVDEYFKHEKEPTLAGLACALDISRSSLYNYGEKDGFLDIIKKARRRVEDIYEKRLIYSDKPTGVIFALKNMDWRDSQNIDHTTKGKPMPVPILGGLSRNVPANDSTSEDKPVK